MKLTISMSAITYAAKLASGFAASAADLPELRCLKFDATGPMLTITAFNRTMWVKLNVAGAEIAKTGMCLIPAAEFRRWIAAGDNSQPLTIEIRGTDAHLTNGQGTCKMPVLDVNKYSDPTTQSREFTTALLKASTVIAALSSVSFAADRKDVQKVRTDVLMLDIDDEHLHVMASDGKVVSVMKCKATINGPKINELLPFAVNGLLPPLLESIGEADATLKLSQYEAVIDTERFEFGTRLISSTKFQWRKLMERWDNDRPEKIKLPSKEFLAAIRQVSAADPSEYRIDMDFGSGSVELRLGDKSSAIVNLPENEYEMRFGVSWEYMIDMLNQVVRQDSPLTLEWGANDSGTNYVDGQGSKSMLFRIGADWRYMTVPLVEPKK